MRLFVCRGGGGGGGFSPVFKSPTQTTAPLAFHTHTAREIATLPQPGSSAAAAPLFGSAFNSSAEPDVPSPRHLTGGGGAGGPLPVALVLIDRSLDLATPCGASDQFWDGAPTLLQRRPAARAPQHAQRGRWALHR